jgi:hypothetical protein
MRALVAAPYALALVLAATRATGAPHVVVLEPKQPGLQAWPQGQRAVIAELSASGFDLVLRHSQSGDVEQLTEELLDVAQEADALGALALARQGSLGLVLVVTAHSGLVRMEVPVRGSIAEGSAALRVAELLRSLQIPAREAPAPRPSADGRSPLPTKPLRTRPRRGELWADAGVALSSDVTAPMLALGAGGSLRIWNYLSAELSVRLMPMHTRIETTAGSLDLRAAQSTLHFAFSPVVPGRLGFTLGLGGGALVIDESAQGGPGFRGRPDRAWATLLSARARAFAHYGPLVTSLMFEPGLTLPAVTVRAADDELARLGRPWASLTLGLGLEL